jgi:mannose-1-phosphate guanylyltransferase
MNIRYSIEHDPLGTGGALKNAEPLIKPTFLLLNGDTISLINYSDLIESYKKRNFPVMITVYDNSQAIVENNIQIGKDGLVTAYNKKSQTGMNAVDSGILVVNKTVFFSLMPDKPSFSFEYEIYPKLISNWQMIAYHTNIRFYDIGTPARLKKIEEIL